jgi:broad specificity phosphatase PhoE
MRLYFVRHGESEANVQHVISNRASPFALTERGREQAKALAEKLKEIPFTAIFSSPILRAHETTEILSEPFHLPYQVTEALREYDCGILEEKSDEASWRLHRWFYEDWTLRHNYSSKPEGGECFTEIRERFVPFIESFKPEGDDHVLLIGHGGLFHLMLPLVLTNIDDEFVRMHGLSHTECVIAEWRSDGFICRQWGDVQL